MRALPHRGGRSTNERQYSCQLPVYLGRRCDPLHCPRTSSSSGGRGGPIAAHSRDDERDLMFQRDYILRIIEQVARSVARALGLMQERKLEQAESELQSGYGVLGLDRALALVLDTGTLVQMLG